MIKRSSEQIVETRDNMRGGDGSVTIRHYLKQDDINAACRLCAQLIIPPGAGIGEHEHKEEDEVYIIQAGQGVITDNGADMAVGVGDAILTGKGGRHAIRNTGRDDLIVTAVIMLY